MDLYLGGYYHTLSLDFDNAILLMYCDDIPLVSIIKLVNPFASCMTRVNFLPIILASMASPSYSSYS